MRFCSRKFFQTQNLYYHLRTVPTTNRAIFALFVTMREKQTLAGAIEIQKGNWG